MNARPLEARQSHVLAAKVPDAWREPLRRWELALSVNRSNTTVRTRVDSVARVARALDVEPAAVTRDQLAAWLVSQNWSRGTRRSMYQSIRQFFSWAALEGIVGSSPADEFRGVGEGPPAPRPLPDDALVDALLNADRRTWLAIRLAADLGLRRAEVAQVHVRDLVRDWDGWVLHVKGKGAKTRVLPVTDELANAIRTACSLGGGQAFPGTVKGHLSAEYLGKLVRRCLPTGWSMHSLRHRFATRAFNRSHDLMAVQQLLGHASVATTQRYVRVEAERLRAIVEQVAWRRNPT